MTEKTKKRIYRVVSSLILFPIVAATFIFADNLIMDVFVAIIALLAIYEFYNCFRSTGKASPMEWIGYISCIVLVFMHTVETKIAYGILIGMIPTTLLLGYLDMAISRGKKNFMDILVTVGGVLYIPFMMFFISELRAYENNGRVLIWYIIASSWASDICAYVVGSSKFGKHKFSKISPNKTIEGSVAGFIGAIGSALLFTFFINKYMGLNISYMSVSWATLILCALGQIGDFFASSIKRYCGVKDFSELIPGHGGMLDRIDSIIFMLPYAYAILKLLV